MKVVHFVSALFARLRRPLHVVSGILALCLLFVFAGRMCAWLRLPLPAGVVGMGGLLLLLSAGVLPLRYIRPGADWLLAEMLLFFVPAFVGLLRYVPFLTQYGVRLLVAVVLGTVSVLISTAVAVDVVYRLEQFTKLRSLRKTCSEQLRPNPEGMA